MANSNEYMKDYMANRRITRRSKLIEMRGGKCETCGSTEKLEFNHRERTEKRFGLDAKGMDKSWNSILEELEKCDLLCSKCHLEYTRNQYSNGEIPSWNRGMHGEYIHGTARMYHEMKCRCDRCKLAKKIYRTGAVGNSDVVA